MFYQHSAQNGGVGGGVKKVSTNVGKYVQYITEIYQSYQLGFTPNRLNRSRDRTFALPIRIFNNCIYATGDTTMSDISDWVIKKDKIESKLVYFTKGGHTTPSKEIQARQDQGDSKEIQACQDPQANAGRWVQRGNTD